MALLNSVEKDVKIKCIECGVTQAELAKRMGTTRQSINRVLKNANPVNKMLVAMLEQLGYDIQLTYLPRNR